MRKNLLVGEYERRTLICVEKRIFIDDDDDDDDGLRKLLEK